MSGLILTRRPGEAIFIGSNVKITVLGWKGSQVRISIDAPRELSVDREEIRERKVSEATFKPGEVK